MNQIPVLVRALLSELCYRVVPHFLLYVVVYVKLQVVQMIMKRAEIQLSLIKQLQLNKSIKRRRGCQIYKKCEYSLSC